MFCSHAKCTLASVFSGASNEAPLWAIILGFSKPVQFIIYLFIQRNILFCFNLEKGSNEVGGVYIISFFSHREDI